MYEVLMDGQTVVHSRHANQLRTRLVTLPTNDSSNHLYTYQTHNSDNPPVLRRSTRIHKIRRTWSPSN